MGYLSDITYVLLLLLAANHLIRARRGLREGVVEGLVIGYWGKRYERSGQPIAFWLNIFAGFFVGALGAIAFLWGALVLTMMFSDHPL